jgi:uncharacterized protein YjiS (DUF1127 family)
MAALVHELLINSQLSAQHARAALSGLGATLALWSRRWREAQELARLEDRELRDIGLTRTDVQMALAKPFWRA